MMYKFYSVPTQPIFEGGSIQPTYTHSQGSNWPYSINDMTDTLLPQQTILPEVTPIVQQTPRPIVRRRRRTAQPYPQNSALTPEVAKGEAIRLRDKIILFRLNQAYNLNIRIRKSRLLPYSELGLTGTPLEEYEEIIGNVSRFVFKKGDWGRAFELLGEAAFHVFKREEMDIAAGEGFILPNMEERLKCYVEFYPHDAGVDHYFKEFQLPVPRQPLNGRDSSLSSSSKR
ncbi:unnamed protein product [Rhizoctonia solani]|uniref:Uncharacterized protein n=1 Tax=Rhizoctonia solani TaxID=456999 RepID=A0A8H2WD06_9AGAM|nr:unnamed protein product [Rhizoctonia solani]